MGTNAPQPLAVNGASATAEEHTLLALGMQVQKQAEHMHLKVRHSGLPLHWLGDCRLPGLLFYLYMQVMDIQDLFSAWKTH